MAAIAEIHYRHQPTLGIFHASGANAPLNDLA